MKVTILNKILYRDMPSASGLEIIGDKVYIIGDDSPFLYVLDLKTLKEVGKIRLFQTNLFGSGRIPKALKPDLESLTSLTIDGERYLIAFGSGSAPTRTKCYTVKLPRKADAPAEVKEYSLEKLFTMLQQNKTLLAGDLLNLEAAAVTANDELLLFQRSALAGPNALLRFNAAEFTRYLLGNANQLPACDTFRFELPGISELKSRFSGANTFDDKLFFTASIENTTDAILDGEVIGSFVGWLNITALQPGTDSLPLQTALITDQNGQPYKGKVESVAIQQKESANTYRGLAITDNDNGESELLELLITL